MNLIKINPFMFAAVFSVMNGSNAQPRLYVAQSARAFTSNAEGWGFKSWLRQTKVIKTGSDSSTAKV